MKTFTKKSLERNMKISLSIMAHPSREKEAESLYMKLVSMPFNNVTVIYDNGGGEWETGKRALLRNTGDWHVVLQDDAIICDNFYKNLVAALNNVPMKSLVSLYLGTVRPIQGRVKLALNNAIIKNKSWLSFSNLLWGVGIAIPSEDVTQMLKHVENSREVYDRRIGSYYNYLNQPVYYTATSLVDHNDALGSLLGNGRTIEPRVAHRFAGNQKLTFNSKVENI